MLLRIVYFAQIVSAFDITIMIGPSLSIIHWGYSTMEITFTEKLYLDPCPHACVTPHFTQTKVFAERTRSTSERSHSLPTNINSRNNGTKYKYLTLKLPYKFLSAHGYRRVYGVELG